MIVLQPTALCPISIHVYAIRLIHLAQYWCATVIQSSPYLKVDRLTSNLLNQSLRTVDVQPMFALQQNRQGMKNIMLRRLKIQKKNRLLVRKDKKQMKCFHKIV